MDKPNQKSTNEEKASDKSFPLYLVSDATGETLHSLAKACCAQFTGAKANEHLFMLIRNDFQLDMVLDAIIKDPGPVLFTLVNSRHRHRLEEFCRHRNIPSLAILDSATELLGNYLGMERSAEPGLQHVMDAEYFARIDALDFAIHHDDGQGAKYLLDAQIIIVGVSRTSKTPTTLYLANRGYKTANVPLIPDQPLPETLFKAKKAFIVALTCDASALVEIRRTRLRLLQQARETSYVDMERVYAEVADALKFYRRQGWPIIDVTRRSIEETAAEILLLYNQRNLEENTEQ